MKKHREAEHISFPLNQPEASNLTNASLSAKFTPNVNNSMESQVHALLQEESGMDERDLRAKEDRELTLDKITEEVLERRRKMAKMRSYYFTKNKSQNELRKLRARCTTRFEISNKINLTS